MPKFRVQFYGPTIYVEAEDKDKAIELAQEYLGEEFDFGETISFDAEQDDLIPEDFLLDRDR